MGPLILPRETERVANWIREAVDAGNKQLGGGRLSETTLLPSVLLNPPADAKVSQLEVFGPLTCVYGYRDLDDAIQIANSLPYAFQASVFSSDIAAALRAANVWMQRPFSSTTTLRSARIGCRSQVAASPAMASAVSLGRCRRWPMTRWSGIKPGLLKAAIMGSVLFHRHWQPTTLTMDDPFAQRVTGSAANSCIEATGDAIEYR